MHIGMSPKKYACFASAMLLALFVPLRSVAVTVDASTYGYNPTDSTAALQAAIDSGADTVIVPYMGPGNDWIVEPIFLTSSNQTIIFEEDVLVKAKEGSFLGGGDSLFHSTGLNITLSGYGATLQMRQSDYRGDPYPTAEWRMGIRLESVQNFTIKGLTIRDTGGDGIYVGTNTHPGHSLNVTIRDVTIDNAYRNGIGVISVEDLLIDNCIIRNTNIRYPRSGIDFEPDLATYSLTNVNVRNTIIESNGGNGIQFAVTSAMSDGNGLAARVTGSIENCTIVSNGWPGTTAGGLSCSDQLPNVIFRDNLIVNNNIAIPNHTEFAFPAPNVITHSAFWGNGSNADPDYMTLGDGCVVDTAEPIFVSTDINDPGYYRLAAGTPEAIAKGASDGLHMGARGISWLRIEEADDPGNLTPAGYTAYDFFVNISTNMGVMELILNTENAGDIYQNSLIPDDAAELFDTYVTIGPVGENPVETMVIGGAVDMGGGAAATFADQNLDIAWAPEMGIQTGEGEFQIARVVLKNGTANNTWTFGGWQGGASRIFTVSGNISLIAGDVNGDGFIGGADLAIILTNWGMSSARRIDGDLDDSGIVGGGDYTQVLSNWGNGTLPTEPTAVPEPTVMLVLTVGALAGLIRCR